jgi:hypothetical protein
MRKGYFRIKITLPLSFENSERENYFATTCGWSLNIRGKWKDNPINRYIKQLIILTIGDILLKKSESIPGICMEIKCIKETA